MSSPAATAPAPPIDRSAHRACLLELTQVPTASGREWRVIDWLKRWAAARPDLALTTDPVGNLVIAPATQWGGRPAAPIFITAHLDHPAFVVERIIGPGTVELSFRGGVMDPYFDNARIVIHAGGRAGRPETPIGATLTGRCSPEGVVFKSYTAELDAAAPAESITRGDVATWALPPAEIDANGILHTSACDDLAALAAALCAMDALRGLAARGDKPEDVRLLFTRAEEVGFIGAIGACKHQTMPRGSRIIALENSRSFADSPIGGGPIVRVGDRMSVFSPRLTAACAKRAEDISARPASPHATQTAADLKGMPWQRKLMAGGACEATVFCAYGYEATCLCLPLGNYHNMADLAAVQDGTHDAATQGPPRVGREFISVADFDGLVDLLVAIGVSLPEADPALAKLDKLFTDRADVLNES